MSDAAAADAPGENAAPGASDTDPSDEDDAAAAAPPVGRVRRRPDGRGLGLVLVATLGVLALVAQAVVDSHRAGVERAAVRSDLTDLRDFLRAAEGEGFVPPRTAPEGVGLEVVVAAIGSWGRAPVRLAGGRIVVDNGAQSFSLEIHDRRGKPYRFRKPGVKFPQGWEMTCGSEAAGVESSRPADPTPREALSPPDGAAPIDSPSDAR